MIHQKPGRGELDRAIRDCVLSNECELGKTIIGALHSVKAGRDFIAETWSLHTSSRTRRLSICDYFTTSVICRSSTQAMRNVNIEFTKTARSASFFFS